MLRLIRDGRASTRAELVALTGLARSTVAQRMDALLAQRLVVPAGASASTGGRPPKTVRLQPRRRRRARGRPRRDPLARRGHRPRRRRPRPRRAPTSPIADGPDAVLDWLEETFDALLDGVAPHGRRRARRRRRRPRPGRVRDRHPGGAADHARLGRLRVAARLPTATGAPVAGRQRREHHGAGRALVTLARRRPPAVRQSRHRHRLRHHHRRPDPPRRPGRGRRHRPHPRPRPRRRHLPLRQPRLPRGRRRRRRDGRARSTELASRPTTAATSSATCATAAPRRCGSSARPAASSARCSPPP